MSSRDIVAVIAAGGFGSRMGAGKPKSLLRVSGRTLLEHGLVAVRSSGLSRIIVYNDRRAWDSEIACIVERLPGATLVADAGVDSTLELAAHAAERTNHARLCFLYGHAPRTETHLRRLCDASERAVVGTLIPHSTKAHPISMEVGYLEPPYVLPVDLLRNARLRSWAGLFHDLKPEIVTIPLSGPGEANWPKEMRVYRRYVRSSSRWQHPARTP